MHNYVNETLSLRTMIEDTEAERYHIYKLKDLSRAQMWTRICEEESEARSAFAKSGLENPAEIGKSASLVYRLLSKEIHEYPYRDRLVLVTRKPGVTESALKFISGLAALRRLNVAFMEHEE